MTLTAHFGFRINRFFTFQIFRVWVKRVGKHYLFQVGFLGLTGFELKKSLKLHFYFRFWIFQSLWFYQAWILELSNFSESGFLVFRKIGFHISRYRKISIFPQCMFKIFLSLHFFFFKKNIWVGNTAWGITYLNSESKSATSSLLWLAFNIFTAACLYPWKLRNNN